MNAAINPKRSLSQKHVSSFHLNSVPRQLKDINERQIIERQTEGQVARKIKDRIMAEVAAAFHLSWHEP